MPQSAGQDAYVKMEPYVLLVFFLDGGHIGGLQKSGNKTRKVLEKFGENSEQNSEKNPGRKFAKNSETFRSAPSLTKKN